MYLPPSHLETIHAHAPVRLGDHTILPLISLREDLGTAQDHPHTILLDRYGDHIAHDEALERKRVPVVHDHVGGVRRRFEWLRERARVRNDELRLARVRDLRRRVGPERAVKLVTRRDIL